MKLYIIPAYQETLRNKGYRQIVAEAKKKKYEIEILNLQIKGNSLSVLTNLAIKTIGTDIDCTIFGFSMGALIAYNISTKISVKKVILASISPSLGSDIKKFEKQMVKYFSNKTIEELKKHKYNKSKSKEIVFLYGEKEGDFLINRVKKLYKINTEKKELIFVKNNDHELNSNYIKEIIKSL